MAGIIAHKALEIWSGFDSQVPRTTPTVFTTAQPIFPTLGRLANSMNVFRGGLAIRDMGMASFKATCPRSGGLTGPGALSEILQC